VLGILGIVRRSRQNRLTSQNETIETIPKAVPEVPKQTNPDTSPPISTPPITFPDVASGKYSFSFTAKDGLSRTYQIYIPKNYNPSKKHPVLFAFHGGFGTAETFENGTGFSILADARGYIAVYGQGTATANPKATSWNAGACCGSAQEDRQNVDDVNYVRNVISLIKTKYNIDQNRIYATGMSNGGMFANRLACEASDLFAGVSTVSGTITVSSCNPQRQTPILIMHGTNDTHVPYNGGVGPEANVLTSFITVEKEFADWGRRNDCSGEITETAIPALVNDGKTIDKLTYASCSTPVVLYRINNGEHEWPGGKNQNNPLEKSIQTQVISASETILDFFGL